MKDLLKRLILIIILVLLLLLPSVVLAIGGGALNPDLKIPKESLERFKSLKLGAMICWNPAVLTGKEISWSRGKQTSKEEYDNLYKTFDPKEFDPGEWVRVLKETGFKYLVYVQKHHDGFCMWDTKTTNYNIMNSPLRRDVTKELADACKKQGIAFCLYYSIADFYHPDYQPTVYQWGGDFGGKGYELPDGEKPDFDRYVTYMKAHLRELTESCGPILAWWFDGSWSPLWTKERGADLYAYLKKLQPTTLVSNRIDRAFNGDVYMPTWFASEKDSAGDYAVLEVDIPRFKRDIAWEYTIPANARSYGWTPGPVSTYKVFLRQLVASACGDGNFLLGINAMPQGRFEPKLIDELKNVGVWLKEYGDSVYGTRGGPYMRTEWYGSTCKDNKVYLHVSKTDNGKLELPALPKKIVSYRLLNGGTVDIKQVDQGVTIVINPYDLQDIDTIVELTLNGDAEEIKPIEECPVNKGVVVTASNVCENKKQYTASYASDGDMSTFWTTDKGVTQAYLEYDFGRERTFSRAILFEGKEEAEHSRIRHVQIQIKTGDKWETVKEVKGWGEASPEFDMWPMSVSIPEIRFSPTTARHVRLNIVHATDSPIIHEIKLYER